MNDMSAHRPAGRAAAIVRFPSLAIAAAVVAVHAAAARNGLALDDNVVLANPRLQSMHTLAAAMLSPWWYDAARLYRPLTLTLLGAEKLASGGDPWLPHVVNIGLHALVAVLLYRLCRRFVGEAPALLGALLFAVLPVHAEAVASIVGQAELLCALALACLMLLVTRETQPTGRHFALGAALSAAALASKETGVIAPLLAVAAAWTLPASRSRALAWVRVTAAATVAVLAVRFAVLGTLGGDLPNPVFRDGLWVTRLQVALSTLPRSAAMLVLPVRPAIDDVPTLAAIQHPGWPAVVCGVALVALGIWALVAHLHRPGFMTLGLVVAVATLAPTSNLFFASGVVSSARTLYAPSLGAAMVIAGAAARVPWRRWAFIPVAAYLVAAGVLTRREVPVWHDSMSVVGTMLMRQPDDYRGYRYKAYIARDAGRPGEAETYFAKAIERFGDEPEMLTDAATTALALGDTTVATGWLQRAVAVSPRAARARTRLFALLRARGDSLSARRLLAEGSRIDAEQRTWSMLLAQ